MTIWWQGVTVWSLGERFKDGGQPEGFVCIPSKVFVMFDCIHTGVDGPPFWWRFRRGCSIRPTHSKVFERVQLKLLFSRIAEERKCSISLEQVEQVERFNWSQNDILGACCSLVQPGRAWYSLVQSGAAWYILVHPGTVRWAKSSCIQ